MQRNRLTKRNASQSSLLFQLKYAGSIIQVMELWNTDFFNAVNCPRPRQTEGQRTMLSNERKKTFRMDKVEIIRNELPSWGFY